MLRILFLIISMSVFHTAAWAQASAGSRAEKWREDVRFYARELPARHKNLFFHLSKEEFERDVRLLEKDVERLTDDEIKLRLMTLTARINDGHTLFYWEKLEDITVFPIRLRQFPEGFYAVETAPAYKEILGKRLVKMGDVKIDEAARRVRRVFAAENDFGVKNSLSQYLVIPFILKANRITNNTAQAVYTFADANGEKSRANVEPVRYADYAKSEKSSFFDGRTAPLALRNADKNYWFEYLPDEKTLYLAYNVCQEDKSKSFAEFAKEMFAVVDKSAAEKIVVDLRRNGGGNSKVLHPLYDELVARPELSRKGKLFILTSRQTFSSGFLNAIEMKQKFGALWIGEPSAQAPVGYGEVKNFDLPNSKLRVQYSTKKYTYDENEKRDFMPVDVSVEETFADFSAGRDAVLTTVFKYQ